MRMDPPAPPPRIWTWMENKMMERALAKLPQHVPSRWQVVADKLHGMTATEVKEHYEKLEQDVKDIESGRFVLPKYSDDDPTEQDVSELARVNGSSKSNETRKKKGISWTLDEHRLFLEGLKKFGKGDWRSISRHVVVTKTATQVASHAQKYFLRQNEVDKKARKRSSIHDIVVPADDQNQTWVGQPGLLAQQLPQFDHLHEMEDTLPQILQVNPLQSQQLPPQMPQTYPLQPQQFPPQFLKTNAEVPAADDIGLMFFG